LSSKNWRNIKNKGKKMKAFLVTFAVIAVVLLGYIIYGQETKLANYEAREAALLKAELGKELFEMQISDSVSKIYQYKISELKIENIELKEKLKYTKSSLTTVTELAESYKQELEHWEDLLPSETLDEGFFEVTEK